MQTSITPVDSHRFSPLDRLLFDANVWLKIYGVGSDPNDQDVKAYSAAYRRCLEARSSVFVDALVLSEFVNRYSRWKFQTLPDTQRVHAFKTFRASPSFKPAAREIADACRRILGATRRLDDPFSSVDVKTLLTEFETGRYDFNDQILARLCQDERLSLVTHDGDFADAGISILTANRRMLSRRPG